MVVLLKDKPVVKIVKLRRIDKLFTDLIFSYFTMLEALFNFPKWMHLFGFLYIGVGGYPYLLGSNTTWGEGEDNIMLWIS